eukprot:scaffold188665_cov17-Tisochrysis_lutea.AAC.1
MSVTCGQWLKDLWGGCVQKLNSRTSCAQTMLSMRVLAPTWLPLQHLGEGILPGYVKCNCSLIWSTEHNADMRIWMRMRYRRLTNVLGASLYSWKEACVTNKGYKGFGRQPRTLADRLLVKHS